MPKLLKNKKSLQLRLVALDELSFSYNASDFTNAKGTVDIDVQADLSYRQEGELFTVVVTARFFYNTNGTEAIEPKSTRLEVAHLTAQLTFHIPEAAQVLEPTGQPNELRLPTPVAATLVGTAYSTLRGMVFVRFAHTPLHQMPLSLIDPTVVATGLTPFRIAEA